MKEELGIVPTVGRLIWVMEKMAVANGEPFDNMELYFEITLSAELFCFSRTYRGREGDLELLLRWHRIDELDHLTLYLESLKRGLTRRDRARGMQPPGPARVLIPRLHGRDAWPRADCRPGLSGAESEGGCGYREVCDTAGHFT